MKPTIILLSILLSQGVKAQTKYDTVPCIMECIDTTIYYTVYDEGEVDTAANRKHMGDSTWPQLVWTMRIIHDTVARRIDHSIFWQRGYELVVKHNTCDGLIDPYMDHIICKDYWQELPVYFDEKKQPMKYFVWDSKQIK